MRVYKNPQSTVPKLLDLYIWNGDLLLIEEGGQSHYVLIRD